MGAVGLLAGAGGVIAGGYAGDAITRKRAGGHSLTIGVSMLAAAPLAALTLMVTSHTPVHGADHDHRVPALGLQRPRRRGRR